MDYQILVASKRHLSYSQQISALYQLSARERGTGIATRASSYIEKKMKNGNAVIALLENQLVGFCYIETFDKKKYVSNSGLIVESSFRGQGIAKRIKQVAFQLARDKYPDSKVFGITTSSAVMKINSELGYIPVSFSELTKDEAFWKGCSSCSNYEILLSKNYQMCLCTGMLAASKTEQEHLKGWEQKISMIK